MISFLDTADQSQDPPKMGLAQFLEKFHDKENYSDSDGITLDQFNTAIEEIFAKGEQ